MADPTQMEKIVSLAKRRGFVYPGSTLYGGLSGMWDYGPLGVALRNNVRSLWWKMFVDGRDDMYGLDAAILMRNEVWQASGHAEGFVDPVVDDTVTGERFRADHLLEGQGFDASSMTLEDMNDCIRENKVMSPAGNPLSDVRTFNMMFETQIGPVATEEARSYLRPETAQGIFANFKNVLDSLHPSLPFGIGQIGKAFRNEIAPRDFIFRGREFEQMEIEYFVKEEDWKEQFEHWREEMWRWIDALGLSRDSIHELEVPETDRAHYSKRTIDFEFEYPFGRKELYGLAYRGNYDLTKHMEASGVDLHYFDQTSGEKVLPHVIEPSLGMERTILALLTDAYTEDELDGESRVYLNLAPAVAPVRVAVFPLLKNKEELTGKAKEVFHELKKTISRVVYDQTGSIGKRYRRQDEIGTPHCVTVDFDTLEDDTVTLRDRNSGTQERVAIAELADRI